MAQVTVGGVVANGNTFANDTRQVDTLPNECPICHLTMVPNQFSQGFDFVPLGRLELYFRCTNSKCLRTFIAMYKLDAEQTARRGGNPWYVLVGSLPVEPKAKAFDDVITALSPSFVRIWTQAQTAEDQNLEEIAGPGFRKALEFLIKDYAISLAADEKDKDNIKAIQLQAVIKNYLTGDKLPVVSSRAAWLGNDETHYERRWVGKNLQDLKKLIEATEHFIAMEKLVAAIPLEMPNPKDAVKIETPATAGPNA